MGNFSNLDFMDDIEFIITNERRVENGRLAGMGRGSAESWENSRKSFSDDTGATFNSTVRTQCQHSGMAFKYSDSHYKGPPLIRDLKASRRSS